MKCHSIVCPLRVSRREVTLLSTKVTSMERVGSFLPAELACPADEKQHVAFGQRRSLRDDPALLAIGFAPCVGRRTGIDPEPE